MKNISITTLFFLFFLITKSFAITKTSNGSGNWQVSSTWTPSGAPGSGDDVIITGSNVVSIVTNVSCQSITVGANATLSVGTNKTLTITGTGGLTDNGTITMNGDITLSTSGSAFVLGPNVTFTWNPGTNTAAGATLFTNGVENFSSSSTLIMNKWYSMTTGLGAVVSCNFGNLKINTGGTWHMNNSLQTRSVTGTLTIQSSYVILDESGSISTTNIGSIVLANSTSYLDFFDGTHPSSFTVNTASITITGGELDCFYTSGTGNCTLNVSGNVTLTSSGKLAGANGHNGNVTMNISGNVDMTRGYFYGCKTGNGNSTIVIGGNLTLLKSGATYSEFYSIVDGNGTACLTITGNFSNQGYFDLIWNTGVTGVGNGNSSMTVSGTFTQSDGDFRGVWNLTTTTAGTCSITMNTINYSGGVFMVYYAVSSTAISNTFLVNGNLNVNFTNTTDIFRGNGLANLSSVNNLAGINITISGTTTISGNASAEFSNNVAYGNETMSTTGNIVLSGGTNKFHNGNHIFNWNHAGNISVTGGTNYFSAEAGAATITITGNLSLSGGTLSTKTKGGSSTVSIAGSFTQTGGTFYLYNNSSTSAAENISVNINGDFTQTAGTINYSDNSSSTGIYSVNLSGSNYTIGGTGSMTSAAAGTGTLFGQLNFNKTGTINFTRSAITHSIQQVKQTINNGTTLLLASGNLQIASLATAGTSFLTIANGGILNTGTNQILSNGLSTYSGLNVASGGKILTANTNGLYDGTSNATINYAGNMDFNLNANSTIEYNGVDNQIVTGFGVGIATQTQHKYGNLTINFNGTTDVEYTSLSTNTYVRTKLNLTSGELKLNNNNLIIETGNANAITRTSGYIKSETNLAVNNSIVKWMNITSGAHIYPFAVNSTSYIPVTISPTSGTGGYVEISTRATGSNNTPFTGLSNVNAVTNLNRQGVDISVENIIDRWWVINAPGITADLTLSYLGAENTTNGANSLGSFAIQSWDGTRWATPIGTAAGVTTGVGSITGYGISSFSPIVLASSNGALPIKLLSFDVNLNNDQVDINWSTASEKDNDYFTVERSGDGKEFNETDHIKGSGTCFTTKKYSSIDAYPLQGKSYYRLKQTDYNGHFTYSPIRIINTETRNRTFTAAIEVISIGPNPFKNQFTLNYRKKDAGESRITIMNMEGQIVYDETKMDNEGACSFDYFDNNNLAPGNYILNVISGNEKITKKLIKTAN